MSHASEDKDEVVRPLANAQQDAGLTVWYDEYELWLGDSLRRKIDRGLIASHFGVVVLSEAFFRKGWANYELDGLVTKVSMATRFCFQSGTTSRRHKSKPTAHRSRTRSHAVPQTTQLKRSQLRSPT